MQNVEIPGEGLIKKRKRGKSMNSKQIGNFKYLDNLVHSGKREIALDSDIILDEDEIEEYSIGIKLDLDDLTIDGNGHTIDACGKGRIFTCIGQDITIRNITLKNGYGVNGGAIYNKGSLEIANSNFKENEANNDGGAIYNYRLSKLSIIDSTFNENKADNRGGAICNSDKNKFAICKSALNKNTAEYGGAICGYKTKMTISQSTLNQNIGDSGGAIRNDSGELTITDSTLNENMANHNGGAISNVGSTKERRHSLNDIPYERWLSKHGKSIPCANRPIRKYGDLRIRNSTIHGNIAKEYGGAIFLNSITSYKSEYSSFKNNSPEDVYEL